jgi:hypothetical protein
MMRGFWLGEDAITPSASLFLSRMNNKAGSPGSGTDVGATQYLLVPLVFAITNLQAKGKGILVTASKNRCTVGYRRQITLLHPVSENT